MTPEQILLALLGVAAPLFGYVRRRYALLGVVVGAVSALIYVQEFGFDVYALLATLAVAFTALFTFLHT